MSRSCAEKLLRRGWLSLRGGRSRVDAGSRQVLRGKFFYVGGVPTSWSGGAEYRQHNVIVPGRSHTTNKSIRGRLYRDEHPNLPLLPPACAHLVRLYKTLPA